MIDETRSIRNILTLRYNPEEASPINHKSWTDFSPTESDPHGKQTEARLSLAIRRKLQDYDDIGIALSSGVDSSLILALIRKEFPNKKILALHYTGVNNDELEASRKLAHKFNCEFYAINPKPVIDNIEKMIKMMDAPKWDAYDFVIPNIARLEGCNILITGDGSDELYAGYTFRYDKFEHTDTLRFGLSHRTWSLIKSYLDCHNHDFVADQENLFQHKFDWMTDIFPYFTEYFNNPLSDLQKVILADFNGKLCHNFLVKKEKFSKEFNIEIWSPFLDNEILNYATHIPLNEKYHNGIGKLPLRAICKRLGLDPPIRKLGFTHDIKSEWNNYHEKYNYVISNPECKIYQMGIINFDWYINNVLSQEERVINKLVSLYTLEKYLQWKQH